MAKILIIDDDLQVLQLFKNVLEKSGYDVYTATNGVEGLVSLEQQNFDVVITDMVMPEKDGIEVIGSLRNKENRPSIIAISGGSRHLDTNYLLEIASVMKVDLVVRKPITPTQLREAVAMVLLAKS